MSNPWTLIIKYQYSLINCNKCIRKMFITGETGYMETVLPSQFSCKSKLT